MTDWQPIDTAPKDGTKIILYWQSYVYDIGEAAETIIAIGRWKHNYRLVNEPDSMVSAYFSDSSEFDDYGLSLPVNSPTHWMPLPEPPK